MSGERLTRTELSWLLTQEAKSAAEKLRKGVGLSQPPPSAPQGAPGSSPPAHGPAGAVVREGHPSAMVPPPPLSPLVPQNTPTHGIQLPPSTPAPPLVSLGLHANTGFTPAPAAVNVQFANEDTGVENVLNRLDETMSMLASLYGNQARGRRGKIDIAALLWEIAPEARVQIDLASDAKEAGKGLVVVGDENELRRMLHVLMALGGDPIAQGAVEVSVKREGEDIRVSVELGPDKTQGFEAETQWLSRMATRYGGRFSLEGNKNTLSLLASDEQREVQELKRELAAAQAQGEAYARELAAVMSSRSEPPPPMTAASSSGRSSSAPGANDGLASLVGMARSLVTDVRGILAAIGRDMAPLRERGRWGERDAEIAELAGSVGRHVTAASEVVSDLARLAGCPLFEGPQPCSLADIARDVVKAEQLRATRHGVTVELSLPQAPMHDEHLPVQSLNVLFQELLDSAISVSPADSKVFVTVADTPTGVAVMFDDSGPTLTTKAKNGAMSRDFDALVQERASALPLIAAFAIAGHLHAPLTLEDSPRGGARVRILFPRAVG